MFATTLDSEAVINHIRLAFAVDDEVSASLTSVFHHPCGARRGAHHTNLKTARRNNTQQMMM